MRTDCKNKLQFWVKKAGKNSSRQKQNLMKELAILLNWRLRLHFLADKVNAAIRSNEPLSEVIFNQKGIPAIKIPAFNHNIAKAQLAKITEENQESYTTTGT